MGGGQDNHAGGTWATVAGGHNNSADTTNAFVGGGIGNTVSGMSGVVCGGYGNRVSGEKSVIPGGEYDSITTDYSMAAGRKVKIGASAHYTMAFGHDLVTTTPYAVVFYHDGQTTKLGVGIENPTYNIDVAGGAYCNGTNWVNGSSRRLKDNIAAMSPEELANALEELERAEVVRYTYKSEDTGEEHIGLIAEDAPEAIATPERDGINTADAIGWLVAIAKAQQTEIEKLKARLETGGE